MRFAPQTAANSRSTAIEETQTFSLADEDEPDLIIDGKIDLGALTAEFFALGLDPYPRRPEAVLDREPSNSEPTNSPFAALAERGKPKGE